MKPKLGRPRRTRDAATVRLTIRLTPSERAELDRAAAPLSVSDWIRDIALAEARNANNEGSKS